MKRKQLQNVILVFLLLIAPALADYGSIAYSPSTQEYGYSHGWATRDEADDEALNNCYVDDARIVIWVRDGWAALALNKETGEWATGWSSASRSEAESIALQNVDGGGASILCWVRS
jgi:Domain of unknown function (DUF4189)